MNAELKELIEQYVKCIIDESSKGVKDSEIDEFSGAGSIVGALAPTVYVNKAPKKKPTKKVKLGEEDGDRPRSDQEEVE